MKKHSAYLSIFDDDPETRRNRARLWFAIDDNDDETINKLLCHTPELLHMTYGADKLLPLEHCIMAGKLSYCKVCVEFGADVSHVGEISGDSLVHLAARQTVPDILEFLVSQGAPLDYQNSDGYTALMECVDNIDVEGCAILLSAGADVTTRRARTGLTALHMAIAEKHEFINARQLSLIRLLISFTEKQDKLALDNESVDRDTPLLTAIRSGNFTVAKWLLESGASANLSDKHSYTPLLTLLHSYHDYVKHLTKEQKEKGPEMIDDIRLVTADELIKFLIESGADLTLNNNRGETALHLAVGNNLTEIALKIARKVGGHHKVLSQLNMSGHSVLHMLARGPHEQKFTLEVMALLLEPQIPTEVIDIRAKEDTTALFNAVCNRKLDVARFLVSNGADVKCICNGETLIHAACRSQKIELVHWALKLGIEVNFVNRDYQTALHLAASSPNALIMQALMDAGGDVNKPTKPDGYSPFYIATRCGHVALVECMLPKAKLDQMTIYGETAMAEASRSGNVQIVSLLIAACADQKTAEGKRFIDLYATRGKPPLVAAAERGQRQVIDLLLRNGANPNLVILDGTTALYAAIGMGQIAATRMLLAWGADLAAIKHCGPRLCCFSYVDPHPHLEMSPFFCAAKYQNLNLAKLCSRFYPAQPWVLARDIITVFTNAIDDPEADARWSPLFVVPFIEFLTSYIQEPPPSLQHQCRMKIRSLLGAPLPLRLAFLNAPLEIKEYLLMKKEISEGMADDPPLPNPPPPPAP